ncbi:MAG: 4Fe-4S dicluster domain-containing protein [Deltaproteobacteria bacterium]|nr:4Fe-4S dicluster domain-containing protein [Deltaproteobacteria bacterium]
MLEKTKSLARMILEEKQAGGVLGLRRGEWDVIQPHLFRTPEELDGLVLEPKWLFAKLSMKILRTSPGNFRLAVICRGCDERAICELVKRNQMERERVLTIGIACSDEQAAACLCTRPYPSKLDAGEAGTGVDPFDDGRVRELLAGDDGERMKKWARLLMRCIKCYGCRNACPICVCEPCKLEDDVWVRKGTIPTEMMTFHLIRSFHLSDTCVACGACQEACPVDIPLLLLQISMRKALQERFEYEAGLDQEKKSPILRNFIDEPEKDRDVPAWVNSLGDEHGP